MSYKVLARKWRPQVFEDVIGQEHISQTLINAIKTDRLAHAYLFSGPRGIGKTSVARILAKAINCREGEPGIPCNKCRSCVEITDGSSTDVQEIDGASNRGIDEIRELRENVKYMPSSSAFRVYIIDEVHMLTLHAFNALLKTLEEPPAHVKFIFATTETHKVPMTILSRCQRFDFKKIPPVKIIAHLERILKEENIGISKSGLAMIAGEADGCMRDAQSLLDQVISFAGDGAGDEDITEILGIIDRSIILDAARAIIEGDAGQCFEIVSRIYNFGHDMKEFYKALMGQFRDLLVSGYDTKGRLLDAGDDDRRDMESLAKKAGSEKLQIYLNFMINREQELRYSADVRLMLEAVMIKLCTLDKYLSFDQLMQKIQDLEKRMLTESPVLSSNPQSEMKQVLEPDHSWDHDRASEVNVKHEAVNGANESANSQPESWETFLDFLKSKSRPMHNVLKGWDLLSLDQGTLEIAKGKQSFSADYFDDNENLEQLTSFCREYFNRDMRIVIKANQQDPADKKKTDLKAESRERESINSDLPQPVQDILRVFQGEVKNRRTT